MKARVTVYPRREILDPQGKAIRDALSRVGFPGVDDVRAGKSFEIDLGSDDPAAADRRAARHVREAARQHRGRGLRGRDPRRRPEPSMKCGVVVFPGSNCDHDVYHVAQARARRRTPTSLWHQDHDLQGARRGRPARRLRLRRLPARRRHGGALAGDGRGQAPRRGRRAGARHLQRLPDAPRGGPAPRRACRATEPALPLPRRPPAGRAAPTAVHPAAPAPGRCCACRSPTARGTTTTPPRRSTRWRRDGQVVFRYVDAGRASATRRRATPTARRATSPASATPRGNVVGLMPHPERCAESDPRQHGRPRPCSRRARRGGSRGRERAAR